MGRVGRYGSVIPIGELPRNVRRCDWNVTRLPDTEYRSSNLLPELQQRLYERHFEHRFIIVGEGQMRAWLEREMPDAVFTGALSRQAVADAFASADAFVFPSRTDTAGNVVLEAQASGLPVVVTDAGGPRENMVNGATGVVCPKTDPDAWADVITRMMTPESHTACSQAARAYALERQWPHTLEPLYRAYRDAFVLHAAAPPEGVVPVSAADRV